jgi:AhpD family alkylhydroperoxidase
MVFRPHWHDSQSAAVSEGAARGGGSASATSREQKRKRLQVSVEPATGPRDERMIIQREAPGVSKAMAELEREITLEPVVRELVKLRASILNGCAYCIDMHSKVARKAGESEQRLYAVAAWQDAPFFSERERAALALTDAITLVAESRVPTDVYEQAVRYFDSEELAHLIWQIAAINVWNRVAIATRTTAGNYEP